MRDLRRREAIGLNHTASAIILTASHMPAQSTVAGALRAYAVALRKLGRHMAHEIDFELPVLAEPQRRRPRSNVIPVLPEPEIRRQEAVALRHVVGIMHSVADVLPVESQVGRRLYLDADELAARAAELATGDPRRLPPSPPPSAAQPEPTSFAA